MRVYSQSVIKPSAPTTLTTVNHGLNDHVKDVMLALTQSNGAIKHKIATLNLTSK